MVRSVVLRKLKIQLLLLRQLRILVTIGLLYQSNEIVGTSLIYHRMGQISAWKRAVVIAIRAQNKIGFTNRSSLVHLYNQWITCDSVVQSWIVNSYVPQIGRSILYDGPTEETWTVLKCIYARRDEQPIFVERDLSNPQSDQCLSTDALIGHAQKHHLAQKQIRALHYITSKNRTN